MENARKKHRRPPLRNDVMHSAFMSAEVVDGQINSPLVKKCMRAIRRFRPSRFGGWRVINRRAKSGKRNR